MRGLVVQHKGEHLSLDVIEDKVVGVDDEVTSTWQRFQQTNIQSVIEREEHYVTMLAVKLWVQEWRPTLMMVPAAKERVRVLPAGGGTLDDLLNVATDMKNFLET